MIPLRPLGVGELIEGTIRTVRLNWRTVLGISFPLALATQSVATVVTGLWLKDVPDLRELSEADTANPGEFLRTIGDSLSGTGVAWAVGLLGSIIATAMLTVMVSRAVLGRSTSAGEAWRSARPQLGRMCGLLVLVPLLMAGVCVVGLGGGVLLYAAGAESAAGGITVLGGLVAMVVATWLWIRYSLAAPALMLEKQGVLAAMRRSAKLVQGAWWRVFGVQLLALFLTLVISMVVQLPIGLVEMLVNGGASVDPMSWAGLVSAGIGAVISSTIALPLSAGMTALLYMDQRIRRESLDLELARAAGE
ncbi:glycerophosphoryl diester phosphodiesterase membrane domain-containing protein [Streptomyces stramineus]